MVQPDNESRRRLLRLAAAAASTLWLPGGAYSQGRFGRTPFSLGVASGSPDDTSVVLWTRLLPGGESPGPSPVTVQWEIADDEGFQRIVARGVAQALPELAHSVHVEAGGLRPDRWYFYRFMQGNWVSPVGRTRTLPAPDGFVQKLRLGYASCQRWEHGYYAAWRHMRADAPDLVLFLGDYIYEHAPAPGAVRASQGLWAISLSDYRDRHALYKSDPDLQAMHAACPWLVTWDDHEVQNDYAGLQEGRGGPSANHTARRAAAYQAYYEHMPLRASAWARAQAGLAQGAEMRLYSQRRFGRLAQLYMLDTRQYKDPQACTPKGRFGSGMVVPGDCEAWNDPRRSMLGTAQEEWLRAQLARAGDGWTVLGQSTVFGAMDVRAGEGELRWNDGWDGYPAARRRLTEALQQPGGKNSVLFGGDVHEHWVGHVKADYQRPESPDVAVEFCGTSVTSRTGGADTAAARLAENPHFVFADAQARGYGIADFTPRQLTVQLRGLDDVLRPDSGVRTLASFAVQAGRPRIERA